MAGPGPDRTPKSNRRLGPYARPEPKQAKGIRSYLYDLVSAPFRWGSTHDHRHRTDDGEDDHEVMQEGQDASQPIQLSDEEPEEQSPTGPEPTQPPPPPPASRRRVSEMTGSQSMPMLRRTAAIEHDDSPNAKLARFFADKGDKPLTDVEKEGVFALVQGGGASRLVVQLLES